MRKLGEQWIEECIDGKTHMYKVVGMSTKGLCTEMIIKDLGPVNEDGVLGCPFCGESPTIKEELDDNDERIYAVEHECNIDMTTGWYHDRQTVIDAWNRRV